MKQTRMILTLAGLLLLGGSVYADETIDAQKRFKQSCVVCHTDRLIESEQQKRPYRPSGR